MRFTPPALWNAQACDQPDLFHWLPEQTRRRIASRESWPTVAEYRQLFLGGGGHSNPNVPSFCPQRQPVVDAAGGYDAFIQRNHCVPSRVQSWHDFFNAMVWCHFPESKEALSRLQWTDSLLQAQFGCRTARQNRATHFDESGVVLLSEELELLELVRALRWKELFWERREQFQAKVQTVVFGHAALEAMLAPYVGLMGKALLIHSDAARVRLAPHELDVALSAEICRGLPQLAPLPLLGVPGFYSKAANEQFFETASYFRTRRRKPSKAGLPEIVSLSFD